MPPGYMNRKDAACPSERLQGSTAGNLLVDFGFYSGDKLFLNPLSGIGSPTRTGTRLAGLVESPLS